MSTGSPQPSLKRGIGRPLYEQIKQSITGMIATGLLRPGDRLPPTQDLCERFGVSHITVTKALHDLARDGIVTRMQGKGTFVTGPPIERRLTNLVSFTREMARQGLVVRSRILGIQEIAGTPTLNQRFGRAPDEPTRYVRITRLRFVDGMPACMATSLFPEAVGRRLAQLPLEHASFYDVLENTLGLHLFREERWISPIVATSRLARLLEVPRGAPLFRLEGMTFLEGDVPIEATDAIFRGDRFRFVANVFRFIGTRASDDRRGGGLSPPVEEGVG
ncbi:MAG: GntR family transcriptional regulator [Armatimonadota bacterium]|nr:GntR family transcriptional regulator [Armatimonadota bacterium]MDR7485930.1 GntR family transcriptional regulator [Armatimonadota bacterium]MDR7533119.1 GntR family transcriptional regulator [Armatimonadota bacterium]MDR7536635.1 GntR family transcriptional regulator [Armatimonadota bacterium]